MRSQARSEPDLGASAARHGTSRLAFRGLGPALDGRPLAFVGGSDTAGRGVARPFTSLVEEALGHPCINLGRANASIDVALRDVDVLPSCRDAALTVVEVTGAGNVSNRFYHVHPRRNDRLTRVSPVMQAIFPDVDFTEFCFTRAMLSHLLRVAPDRFDVLVEELEEAWSARMRAFLDALEGPALLLWVGPQAPAEDRQSARAADPLFVRRPMIDALRSRVQGVVMLNTGTAAPMVGLPLPRALSQAGHKEAAVALTRAIGAVLPTQRLAAGAA